MDLQKLLADIRHLDSEIRLLLSRALQAQALAEKLSSPKK